MLDFFDTYLYFRLSFKDGSKYIKPTATGQCIIVYNGARIGSVMEPLPVEYVEYDIWKVKVDPKNLIGLGDGVFEKQIYSDCNLNSDTARITFFDDIFKLLGYYHLQLNPNNYEEFYDEMGNVHRIATGYRFFPDHRPGDCSGVFIHNPSYDIKMLDNRLNRITDKRLDHIDAMSYSLMAVEKFRKSEKCKMLNTRPLNGTAIKEVKFNPPATIVFWEDGTKTVVVCKDEKFDPEKGLAIAFTKKWYAGNSYKGMAPFYKALSKYKSVEKPEYEVKYEGNNPDELSELVKKVILENKDDNNKVIQTKVGREIRRENIKALYEAGHSISAIADALKIKDFIVKRYINDMIRAGKLKKRK